MWGSKAPASLAVLVDTATAALTGTLVLDGPEVTGADVTEAVVIGYETDMLPAIEHRYTFAAAISAPTREQFKINNQITAVDTGENSPMAAARTRVYELLAQLGQALAANHTLNGLVMMARIGETVLRQSQSESGAVAVLTVAIDCDAITTS